MHPLGTKCLRALFFALIVGSLLDITRWASGRSNRVRAIKTDLKNLGSTA